MDEFDFGGFHTRSPKITMLNHQKSSKMFHFNMVTFDDMSRLIMTLKNPKREVGRISRYLDGSDPSISRTGRLNDQH